MDDNDDLDLSAWQPPAPPPGIADGVFARMYGPPISTPVETTRQPRKWWWAGGIGVAVTFATLGASVVGTLREKWDLSVELGRIQAEESRLHDETVRLQRELDHAKDNLASHEFLDRTKHDIDQQSQDFEVQALVGQVDELMPGGPALSKPCDAAELRARGEKATSAAAVVLFERSLACKPDVEVEKLALFSACVANLATHAQAHYRQIPIAMRSVPQICKLNGIKFDEPKPPATPPCDADGLRKFGDDNAIAGLDGQSLSAYERSYACRADSSLVRLMLMEACKTKNIDKVHKYWKLVPPGQKDPMRQICIRNGVGDADLPNH